MLNLRRRLIAPAVAVAMLAGFVASPGYADDAAPAVVVDAAPAVTVPPGPVIVDTEAGTVTPAPGTPADRIQQDPVGSLKEAVAAARNGNWKLLAALILGAIMVAGVRFGGRVFPKTQRGKASMVVVLSVLGAASTSLATDLPVDVKLLVSALGVTWIAVGAREWLSDFLWPKDGGKQYLVWLKPLLGK